MGLFSKLKASAQNAQSGTTQSNNSNYAPPSPPREKQPINPDSRPLPSGWIAQYDPSTSRFFYVYTLTALRQWEHPADKPLNNGGNRGENSSYLNQPQQQQQQSYYTQQPQQQRYSQQPQYVQQPMYSQQPMYAQQPMGMAGGRMGGMGGMGGMAAAGLGGGLLGYMIADHNSPDIIENNYYDNDVNNYGDGGGFGGGDGFDGGGMDDGGFEMF